MTTYGHTYLTSYGWTGTGAGLRKNAIAKPLVIPPKKNLSGLGKDRDEAFPFWDHLFTAASKAITIRVSSDDEDEDAEDIKDPSHTDLLRRTTTGIISNRRPVSGTPASISGSTTPNPNPTTDGSVPESRLSLLATAKREAAKRGLYARFFRGPVLSSDDDPRESNASDAGPSSSPSTSHSPAPAHAGEQDRIVKSKKRKSDGNGETKEVRREQKRLKKEHKAARAAKRAEKALAREKAKEDKSRLDVVDRKEKKIRSEENDTSSKKRARKSQFALTHNEQQDSSCRPSGHADATHALNIVVTTKKKKGKRKDTS